MKEIKDMFNINLPTLRAILIAICIFCMYNMYTIHHSTLEELETQKQIVETYKNIIESQKKEIEELKKENNVHIQGIENLSRVIKEYKERGSFYYADVKTTAYTSSSNGDPNCPGDIMANGQRVFVGAIAYNDAPLGAKVEIDGKIYTVCDRMAYSGVVDIYMDTYEECIEYGVQNKRIKIFI